MTLGSQKWHSGQLYSWNVSSIPSGYRLGDGVFETIRTYHGVPFRLKEHISRLLAGAHSIGLIDLPEFEIVLDETNRALYGKKQSKPDGEWILRPTFFSDANNWGFVVPIEPWKSVGNSDQMRRVSVGISSYRHPGRFLVPPSGNEQVKWLSRGPLSHALRDARLMGWEEALLLDSNNEVIEGTRSNIILATDHEIITPGRLSDAFPGITREVFLEIARRRGMEITDRPITLEELHGSGELLITSSLLGITSVSSVGIGQNTYKKPRTEISNVLFDDFKQKVDEECKSEKHQ